MCLTPGCKNRVKGEDCCSICKTWSKSIVSLQADLRGAAGEAERQKYRAVKAEEQLVAFKLAISLAGIDPESGQPFPTNAEYASLRAVFDAAVEQASGGKGKERHAVEGEHFEDQKIVEIGARLGSNHFELGQAVKKCYESVRMKPGAARRELLGALNYVAAAILMLPPEEPIVRPPGGLQSP